jgi:transposase
MIIIACDFHPGFQQIAVLDTESGECEERKLMHATGEAEQFYRKLGVPSLVGMESVGNSQWFVQLLERLGHEVRIGDAAQIRASYICKQKTEKRDACHILKLLVEDRFPCIWVPDARMRDQRQMLIHRHKLVQIRTRVKNELQHLMDQVVASAAQQNDQVRILMTQPGVGPVIALAFVLTIGDVKRFDRSKHVAS